MAFVWNNVLIFFLYKENYVTIDCTGIHDPKIRWNKIPLNYKTKIKKVTIPMDETSSLGWSYSDYCHPKSIRKIKSNINVDGFIPFIVFSLFSFEYYRVERQISNLMNIKIFFRLIQTVDILVILFLFFFSVTFIIDSNWIQIV